MIGRQVIWLSGSATRFAALCDECLAEAHRPGSYTTWRAAKVSGSLAAQADVGFTRCRRGHRLCVRRTAGALRSATGAAAS